MLYLNAITRTIYHDEDGVANPSHCRMQHVHGALACILFPDLLALEFKKNFHDNSTYFPDTRLNFAKVAAQHLVVWHEND